MENQANINQEPEKKHKRRVRYKGTHPRSYKEKYKEHNPEKYADTIEKVMSKGSTPAGMHIPIMVEEIMDLLQIEPGQKGLDATLGYGGHTSEMLRRLNGQGHLYAMDVDPIESVKTKARLEAKGYGEDKVAILTFHSGEDRMVKKSFKHFYKEGVYCEVATDVIRPSADECRRNGRARSTKMRWAIKA